MNNQIINFLKYLSLHGVSPKSLKYYKSDLLQFLTWAGTRKISQALIQEYITEIRLITPTSTLNRRLSTLRSYGSFLGFKKTTKSWQDSILIKFESKPRFKNFLNKLFFTRPNWYRKYHSYPIASYVHIAILVLFTSLAGYALYDQVFRNADNPLAFPTALTRPNRYLSFQGRLTDNLGNPKTVATNMVFQLYSVSTGGTALWNSGTCSITPDQDGVFSTLLGSSCGAEIASSVFSENASIWLGATMGADAEATPRVQIATVAYALNSETLQGYPAGTGTSTVPYINSAGSLVLANASPKIQSTSGTFAVEGPAMTLTTPNTSNGVITINPDGVGTLDLAFEGAAPGLSANGFLNATNANITSGSLYGGTVASSATGYNFIDFQSGVSPTSKFSVNAVGNITTAGDLAINGGDLTSSATTFNLLNATVTTLNLGGAVTTMNIGPTGSGASSILLSGGSADTGCTFDGSNGNLTCSGTISGASATTKWNGLTVPDGNLTLAMDADTTTFNWDTLTTGTGWTQASTSLSSGTLSSLSVNSTAAASDTQKVLSLSTAGANATSTQTTYGLYSTNTHTGTASTNVAGYFSASGGTNNYAAIFENGNVGIGTTTPSTFKLQVTGNIGTSTDATYDLGSAALRFNNIYGRVILAEAQSLGFRSNVGFDFIGGNISSDSDLALNGGDLTTTSTGTATVFNTNATTLNIGGAATTMNIGPTGSGASSIVLSGGSADTGCTLNGATGTLTCTTISGAGSFTTLTSTGNTTLGTGASSINTIGSTTTPGTLTLHGATTLDNTFTVSGSNLTTLGGNLSVAGTTGLTFTGVGGDITFTNGEKIDNDVDGTLALTATTTDLSGNLKVTGGNILNSAGTANIIFSGAPTTTANTLSASNWLVENTANVGQAALMVNQTKSGDLFTASASGATKFSITNAGIIKSDTIGTAKANIDIVELTNRVNAVDMDTTRTSILFNQWYYDATTPAVADAGRLTVGAETDWTSTASTQDAFLSFDTALDGTLAEKMRITSGGNVGIGTTAPSGKLHIQKDSTLTGSDTYGIYVDGSQTTANTGNYQSIRLNPAYTASSGNTLAGLLALYSTPRNTGTGTISNLSGAYIVPQNTSSGTVTTTYGVLAVPQKTGTGAITNAFGLYGRVDNTNATGAITNAYGLYIGDSTETGTITNDYGVYQADSEANNYFAGNVGIGMTGPSVALDVTGDIEYTGTITDVSDERLKENFASIINPLDKVLSLDAYKFNMIGQDASKIELGYKAQDIQMILPELVSIVDPENGYLGVNYVGLIPVITEAIKELNAKIIAFGESITSKVIKTEIISPVANTDLIIDLQPDDSQAPSELAIKGVNDEVVTSFDAYGNATISGTLYANNIESDKIKAIEDLLNEVENNQALLTEATNWNTNTATDSANFSELIANNLFVTGNASITSLFVSDNFTTKNINSLTEPLSIQSLAASPLEIMAGRILVDTSGNTKFLGNVEIAGNLKLDGNIIIASNIDPIATESGTVVAGEISSNSTAGKALLPAGLTELKIKNPKSNVNSLIYVTPVTSTQNKVLYVKSKDIGEFTIGFNEAIDTDVEFNWWIIELQ